MAALTGCRSPRAADIGGGGGAVWPAKTYVIAQYIVKFVDGLK